ncbi:hypothetical protein [Paenibacillus sp. BK720]|uniref:hypothetical protein n=1 Tax=Paenibacillus sp. BK720 TaxID=2587092 RepID=UPI001423553F|nr:hypothetical protein [Paenibacillus sp. BK720]NIK69125.1 uncharacterized protein YwgA [Paenibacillus sp. BK720]
MQKYGKNYSGQSQYSDSDQYSVNDSIMCWLWHSDRLNWGYQTKIQMQKGVYLIQILSPLYNLAEEYVKYFSYNYGPFSAQLQGTIHHLCSLGLVDLIYYEPGINGKARYTISEKGKFAFSKLSSLPKFNKMVDLSRIISNMIDIYGLDHLVDIVYEEPTFKKMKIEGQFSKIIKVQGEQNLSTKIIEQFNSISQQMFKREQITIESLIIAYFDYLRASYANSKEV